MTIAKLLGSAGDILRQGIAVLFALATVVFLWGIIKYMTASGNEEKLNEGKNFIIYGFIGLVVMVAAWAVVRSAYNTLFG